MIFSPNALGGVVNDQTLSEFNCEIIAGAANNILEDPEVHGRGLLERGIIYAPDYVINAGGVIHAASGIDYEQSIKSVINKKCEDIYDTLLEISAVAETEQILPHKAADQIVEQRLEMVEKINSLRRFKKRIASILNINPGQNNLEEGGIQHERQPEN